MKIRDEIAQVTKFYFSDNTKLSDSFVALSREGRYDLKTIGTIVGILCDRLEELENK